MILDSTILSAVKKSGAAQMASEIFLTSLRCFRKPSKDLAGSETWPCSLAIFYTVLVWLWRTSRKKSPKWARSTWFWWVSAVVFKSVLAVWQLCYLLRVFWVCSVIVKYTCDFPLLSLSSFEGLCSSILGFETKSKVSWVWLTDILRVLDSTKFGANSGLQSSAELSALASRSAK